MWLTKLPFRTRMLLLVGLFLAGMICTLVMQQIVLSAVRPMYARVMQDKDVIADIMPPPLHLLEPYLVLMQAVEETDAVKRKTLIARYTALETDYTKRHEYWDAKLDEGPLKEGLTTKANEAARSFFQTVRDDVLPKLGTGAVPEEVSVTLRGPVRTAFDQHRAAIDEVVKQANASINTAEQTASDARDRWVRIQLVFSVVIVGLVAGACWFIARSILHPTAALVHRMNDIAEGAADLTQRVTVESDDEIGELARLINVVINRIHDLVARVRVSAVQLHATGAEISAAASEQESTVHSFSASSTEIASAAKEISAAGQELLNTTQDVQARADSAAGLADSGRVGLENMQGSMQRLAEATSSISATLGVVREKANGINAVVTTITKVADQTNLLSINAAIEAEKAGDAGRGFLVVAREIRRLADQTAVATLDIEQMVRHMQSAVSAGVMEMDKFRDDVRHGISQVSEIAGQMSQIIDQAQTLAHSFHGVRESVQQQSLGARQIDDAMSQLVSGVRQVANAARDFNQAATNLRESVSALQNEVSQFKVVG